MKTPRLFSFFVLIFLVLSAMAQEKTEHNPFLPGRILADPEVLLSEQTGRVYVYATGAFGPVRNCFGAYSSDDLVHWRPEGIVLNLRDVSWDHTLGWAPSIIEKKGPDGKFQYFFYFCCNLKIGVAVGDSPVGPFRDSGRPLIDCHPDGVNRGVEIDPDVFQDPKTGKYYLFWGNSYLAMAELGDDMISLKPETVRVLEIPGFFEGAHVFYRDGIYYLTWSKNDTRSVEYQVRYAWARSIDGPWNVPEENRILSKRPEKGIFGPGHHSVLQIPGTDEWFIFYHRLCTPLRPGSWDREVCIDRLFFNEDGSIRVVEPTREGVERRPLK